MPAGFPYQAKTWDKACWLVAKVEWHAADLFPHRGFIT